MTKYEITFTGASGKPHIITLERIPFKALTDVEKVRIERERWEEHGHGSPAKATMLWEYTKGLGSMWRYTNDLNDGFPPSVQFIPQKEMESVFEQFAIGDHYSYYRTMNSPAELFREELLKAREEQAKREAEEKERERQVQIDASLAEERERQDRERYYRHIAEGPMPKGKKQTIPISTDKGKIDTEQTVYGGLWGLRMTDKKVPVVTHLPTGLAIFHASRKADALNFIRDVVNSGLDCTFTDVPTIDVKRSLLERVRFWRDFGPVPAHKTPRQGELSEGLEG